MDALPDELIRKIFTDQNEYVTKSPSARIRRVVNSDVNRLLLGTIKQMEFDRYLETEPDRFILICGVDLYEYARFERKPDEYKSSSVIDVYYECFDGIIISVDERPWCQSVWETTTEKFPIVVDMFTTYQIMKQRPIDIRIVTQYLLDTFDKILHKHTVYCAIELYINFLAFNLVPGFQVNDLEVKQEIEIVDGKTCQYYNRLQTMIDQMSPVLREKIMALP
ncbi:Hypothetical protein POVR1_LOCUS537 [uncultured virus]|nr:Hypothetical protein POVR1_LOCUS537 [uncultured virus]